ncbi:MAG: YfbR-like 5'-deoxynucleotidase [Patescibacteria group bacterium]
MNIFHHILNRSLAHITRFNATPQHFPESVAEHSFYTAYFTGLLCDLLREAGEEADKEKALSMALLHDMEEMFSGDILTPFKHYSSEVTDAIRKVNKEAIPQVFEGLPQKLKESYIALWTEEGQGETREAEIVKVADRLSLLAKCAEEVKVGNAFFEKVYESQRELLENLKFSWWEKIKEPVLEN